MRIAVIGLGEAGALYAEGLAAAGREVAGYDPVALPALEGVEIAPTLEGTGAQIEAVDGGAGAAAERKLLRSVFMKGLARRGD